METDSGVILTFIIKGIMHCEPGFPQEWLIPYWKQAIEHVPLCTDSLQDWFYGYLILCWTCFVDDKSAIEKYRLHRRECLRFIYEEWNIRMSDEQKANLEWVDDMFCLNEIQHLAAWVSFKASPDYLQWLADQTFPKASKKRKEAQDDLPPPKHLKRNDGKRIPVPPSSSHLAG